MRIKMLHVNNDFSTILTKKQQNPHDTVLPLETDSKK